MRSEWRDRQAAARKTERTDSAPAAPVVRPPLSDRQVDRGLRVSIVEGGFAMLYATLGGGMFLTGLALWLGANSFQIALLSAIPALVTGFGFLSGYLVRRAGARKNLLIWTAGIGRSVFVVLVPFLLLRMHVGARRSSSRRSRCRA